MWQNTWRSVVTMRTTWDSTRRVVVELVTTILSVNASKLELEALLSRWLIAAQTINSQNRKRSIKIRCTKRDNPRPHYNSRVPRRLPATVGHHARGIWKYHIARNLRWRRPPTRRDMVRRLPCRWVRFALSRYWRCAVPTRQSQSTSGQRSLWLFESTYLPHRDLTWKGVGGDWTSRSV